MRPQTRTPGSSEAGAESVALLRLCDSREEQARALEEARAAGARVLVATRSESGLREDQARALAAPLLDGSSSADLVVGWTPRAGGLDLRPVGDAALRALLRRRFKVELATAFPTAIAMSADAVAVLPLERLTGGIAQEQRLLTHALARGLRVLSQPLVADPSQAPLRPLIAARTGALTLRAILWPPG